MDEEKTIDDEKTVDEAVEEMTGDMKEFEPVAFDEAVKETEPERKDAPVLRDGGDPEPADMNMIHKHLDNFLAKIAGETPLDENVRDSTEYWLNRIAEAGGGGGESMYVHSIYLLWRSYSTVNITIFSKSATPFSSTDEILQWLNTNGFTQNGPYYTLVNGVYRNISTPTSSGFVLGIRHFSNDEFYMNVIAFDTGANASVSGRDLKSNFVFQSDSVIEIA